MNNYRANSGYHLGPPQPISAVNPITLLNLSAEAMLVNAYGAMLGLQRFLSPTGPHSMGALLAAAFTGTHPDDLEPLGLAFVNGQLVEPKMKDIIESLYWYDEYYDDLYCDYYPGEGSYNLWRNWSLKGGSGGLYLSTGRESF